MAAAGEQRLSELLLSSLVSEPPEREHLPRNLLQTVRIPSLLPACRGRRGFAIAVSASLCGLKQGRKTAKLTEFRAPHRS